MAKRKITSYEDLEKEKKRLKLKLQMHSEIVKQDVDTIVATTGPANFAWRLFNNVLPEYQFRSQLQTTGIQLGVWTLLSSITKKNKKKSLLRRFFERALVVLSPALIKLFGSRMRNLTASGRYVPPSKRLPKSEVVEGEVVVTAPGPTPPPRPKP